MATILNSLKEKFPDIYELLAKNQGDNGLIFFTPKERFYTKENLNDKDFYFHHIFKRSNYDPTLYVNFLGKVLKSIDGRIYKTVLGFTKSYDITVKSISQLEGILMCITDGICIEDLAVISTVGKDTMVNFDIRRCETSEEYIKYYSNENLSQKQFAKCLKAKKNFEKFVYAMKNNNILMKGYEESYSKLFSNYVDKLILLFTSIFKINENNNIKPELIAKEFVDSFINKDLYDILMNKLIDFYSDEEEQLAKRLKESLNKFDIDELKLPNSMNNCDFSNIINEIKFIGDYKTSFEKERFIIKLNDAILNEVKNAYEKETGKQFDTSADFFNSCWIYILARAGVKNLIAECLFFKLFKVKKGYDQNDFIISNFIFAVEYLRKELLKGEKDINVYMVKPFDVETQV